MSRLTLLVSFVVAAILGAPAHAEPVSFKKEVASILLNNCLACHGPKKAEGGYRVDSFERFMKAGDSSSAAITAGKTAESEMFRRITTEDAGERMPLEGDPLPKEQIELLKRWIEEGAKYDAENPQSPLASIVPPPVHPDPPAAYPRTMPITAMAFSPDGTQLVAGGYHELVVWNPADGQMVRRIKNIGQRTYAIAFSPDGKLLAIGCGAPGRLGEARILKPDTGEVATVLGTTSDVVLDVAFSPQGDRLAVAAADGVIRVFEVASGKEQLAIASHSDWVMAVAWNADGSRLGSASRDKTAKVFDAKSGELLVTYAGHGDAVKGIAFHPEGKEVFSAGSDKKVHRWKIEDGQKAADVASFGDEVYKLIASGDFLFTSSADKQAAQYELKTHKAVRNYPGHADWVLSTAVHVGTKRLATGTFDGEIRIWNIEDGKQLLAFIAAPGYQAK